MSRLPRPGRWFMPAAFAVCAFALTAARAEKPDAAKAATAEEKTALDKQIMDEIKTHTEMMKNLAYISDVIGPRLTGSANLKRANEWTAEKMKEYGLSNVHLESWEIPMGWERGTVSMKLVEPGERILIAAAAGWSPGTNGKVTGEVVVVNARTKADLDKYKGKLKNAIIISRPPSDVGPVNMADPGLGGAPRRPNRNAQPPAGAEKSAEKSAEKKDDAKKDDPPKKDEKKAEAKDQPPGGPRGNFNELMSLQRELGEFYKTEGVAAILTDSAKPHGLLVTTGSWGGRDRGATEGGPARLFVAHEHYAHLYRLVTQHKVTPKVEIEVTNKFIPGPITVYNTVGEITGSEKPNEFVVLGAHLDSWDLASGTTDNGTGSSVVLECARVFSELAKKGIKPKRTVRFVLFTGEEQGLHGSKEYVKKHKDELDKTSLALVHDTGTGKVLGFGVLERTEILPVLQPELTALKDVGFEGLTPGGLRGGTDHYSFHLAGVPGFAAKQDPDEYRFTHHTQSDTFDKAKEPNLIQGAQVMAVTAMRVANLPDLLPRPAAKKEEPKKEDAKKDKEEAKKP